MTEESYQQARKIMQQANYRRGVITKAKGDVAKWTKIEAVHRQNLNEGSANGAKKCLDKAMVKLDQEREKFSAIKFPDSDIVKAYVLAHCMSCGNPVAQGNQYCGECICELTSGDNKSTLYGR